MEIEKEFWARIPGICGGVTVYCDCVSSVERGRVFRMKLKFGCIEVKIEKRILVGNKSE